MSNQNGKQTKKSIRGIAAGLLIVMLLFTLCACSGNSPLKGEWKYDGNNKLTVPAFGVAVKDMNNTMKGDLYFKNADTVYVTMNLSSGEVGVKCSYSLDGDTIHIKHEDIDLVTASYKLDGDTLTITQDGKDVVLKKLS